MRTPLGLALLLLITTTSTSFGRATADQTARLNRAGPIGSPTIAGCPMFPPDNVWNAPIDSLPLDPNSATYVNTVGAGTHLHADFGSGLWNGGKIGIPWVDVPGNQPRVNLKFQWPEESDAGPYPVPTNAPIEGPPNVDGDRHILVVDRDKCVLYEVYHSYWQPDGSLKAGSGAVFDMNSNALRPETWTSADAAGLPILTGLVRYEEAAAGEIGHAVRFTVPTTRRAYVWPARHLASKTDEAKYPPMGLRFRLKAGVNINGYSPEIQVILRAFKKYGIILADNGGAWFISGVPDERWNNDHLHEMDRLHGSDFEAVDESSLMVNKNSGQARNPSVPPATATTQPPTEIPRPTPTSTTPPEPSPTAAEPTAPVPPGPTSAEPTAMPTAVRTAQPLRRYIYIPTVYRLVRVDGRQWADGPNHPHPASAPLRNPYGCLIAVPKIADVSMSGVAAPLSTGSLPSQRCSNW